MLLSLLKELYKNVKKFQKLVQDIISIPFKLNANKILIFLMIIMKNILKKKKL